ncbi:hypothetical protein SCUCBS95973_002788 [Sporothrix curviconia]|uniref:Uncharacterized protein n=1 Tax=Sporothrix curviconia TaxID=1260050 RepID=A0ABP0BAZ1_9PEZI
MPSQIFTPVSVSPQRKGLQVVTSTELFASLTKDGSNGSNSNNANANTVVSSNTSYYHGVGNTVITTDLPQYAIREHDYTVPAPPPPSPISFRNDHHWLPPSMVKAASSPLRN